MKLLLTVFLLSTQIANAQTPCNTRINLVTELASRHAEFQTGIGISNSGKQMLELFTSISGTWTIVLTQSNGISCAVAAGQSWTVEQRKPPHHRG